MKIYSIRATYTLAHILLDFTIGGLNEWNFFLCLQYVICT